MTDLKAKAVKIIEQIPDEHMDYVLRNLESLLKESKTVDYTEEELKASQTAFENLMKIVNEHQVQVPDDYDYKEELSNELWRKYESIA